MFPSLSVPVIFAHRGASSHAPENTLASFMLAVEQGAKAIELDVQLTADKEVVVFHDLFLNRTTDGRGKLSDFTLSEIKALNAAVGFEPGYQEERIPTLDEVFSALPEDIFINIELKDFSFLTDNLPEKTAQVIDRFHAHNRVLISSFNPAALKNFFQFQPNIPRGRLLSGFMGINLYRFHPTLSVRFQSIHLPYKLLSSSQIRSFKKRGLKVFTYTLNHPEDILRSIELGVDGFFTNDPAFARRLITGHSP